MMNMWAVAGLPSAARFSMPRAARSIFSSAEASHRGCPQISAPARSAAYSRVREIAICTRAAASGARIITRMAPKMPKGLLRLSPKNRPKLASMEIAPAMVAMLRLLQHGDGGLALFHGSNEGEDLQIGQIGRAHV